MEQTVQDTDTGGGCNAQTNNRNNESVVEPVKYNYASQESQSSEQAKSCCQNIIKNKPTTDSVAPAGFIFSSAGVNIAWSVGFAGKTEFAITTHIKIAWFIGAIVGVIISAILTNHIYKKKLLLVAVSVALIDGLLLAYAYNSYFAVLLVKYMDGFSNGLALIPALILISEEVVKTRRGLYAAIMEGMLYLGIFLQITYTDYDGKESGNAFHIQASQTIISATIGFYSTLFNHIESPIFYLQRNQEDMALESLRRLQHPGIVTAETYERLAECKRYVADYEGRCLIECAICGLPALFKVLFFRIMMSLSFSSVIYNALYLTTVLNEGADAICWTFPTFGSLFYSGIFIAMFLMDSVGRKLPTFIGSLICGPVALGVAVIFDSTDNTFSNTHSALKLMCIFQFFVGFYTCASCAYLIEAFPLPVKSYYMALIYVIQMLIQILLCTMEITPSEIAYYFYFLGALSLIFAVFTFLFLPETKRTSLSDAQRKFRRLLSISLKD